MKVVGVGDNVVDMYLDRQEMFLGGNALNFSVFAAKLHYRSGFVGVFGTDKLAKYAKSTLKHFAVDLGHSKTLPGESGYSRVTLKNNDRVFIDSNRGGVLRQGIELDQTDLNYINGFDIAHFNINGSTDRYLNDINGPVLVYDFSDLYTIDKVKRIGKSIEIGCFSVGDMADEKIVSLCNKVHSLGIKVVLCTRGSHGAVAFVNNELIWQPAIKTQVLDTMGAGDSFITAFSIKYVEGCMAGNDNAKHALAFAARFASQQVKIHGSFDYGTKLINEYNVL